MTDASFSVETLVNPIDTFVPRHIGPSATDIPAMLKTLGLGSLDELVDQTVPAGIRLKAPLKLDDSRAEDETLAELRGIAAQNQVFRSFIGMGYYDTITPPVILRNVLENPGWYTQYTPYQAEIAQGRLEALVNFQTMVSDLTGLPLANASLLDEATAAAEAMHMCKAAVDDEKRNVFFVAADCHPQTIAVIRTRAWALGIEVVVGSVELAKRSFAAPDARQSLAPLLDVGRCFGVLVQYPTTHGRIECFEELTKKVQAAGAKVVVATDLLALTLIRPPGEWGADIAIGSSQRFGVPLGAGGPHAAFMACRDEMKRLLPGRLIGISKDVHGNPAYRLALATREQHIRREKATSNICTAQVLLAVIASMYAVYHGPAGLRRIAQRVHGLTQTLRRGLLALGHQIAEDAVFDTLRVRPTGRTADEILGAARAGRISLRDFGDGSLGVSLDERAGRDDLRALLMAFGGTGKEDIDALAKTVKPGLPPVFQRKTDYLSHPVFNQYHCEHEMLRYLQRLQARDLSLTTSMIPLGSCTMKLNATAEMIPVTWSEFGRIHPFAPADQTRGYATMFQQLENWLAEITGFAAVSLQPNAGSQGEYAGLLAIRGYHESRGDKGRTVCLIPVSAHGTNPASAVMAGFEVVAVACDEHGNIDIADLKNKAETHRERLGALMVTYPSTHGVFEEGIREICEAVHRFGGQVYMDGANMNAQVGLCRPGDIGADVCHLNLHKTFCIPHGGGGPGMGPIGVAGHLAAFLPGHIAANAEVRSQNAESNPATPALNRKSKIENQKSVVGPVSAAPYGSPSILPISWMYIRMMGGPGLKQATQVAILNANYMAKRLEGHYPILYRGKSGRVAHEFIVDLREFERTAGAKPEDVAKRLMDYGFHAPTMSWPVPGTLMIEPTESESKAELDRFCEALIAIRGEIRDIETGKMSKTDNPLKNAPHTAAAVTADEWKHPYSRSAAAFPAPWVRSGKFWPAVGRIDNVWGDRNLFCTCAGVEEVAKK